MWKEKSWEDTYNRAYEIGMEKASMQLFIVLPNFYICHATKRRQELAFWNHYRIFSVVMFGIVIRVQTRHECQKGAFTEILRSLWWSSSEDLKAPGVCNLISLKGLQTGLCLRETGTCQQRRGVVNLPALCLLKILSQ